MFGKLAAAGSLWKPFQDSTRLRTAVHPPPGAPGEQSHAVGQRIGAHGGAARRIERLPDQIDHRLAGLAQGGSGGDGVLAVDVVVTPTTGAELEGFLSPLVPRPADQFGEGLLVDGGERHRGRA